MDTDVPHPVRAPESGCVTYLPHGWFGRILWPVLLVGVSLAFLRVSVRALASVHFVCARSTATCVIASSWGVTEHAESIPLASIQGTALSTFRSKYGPTRYAVVLRTKDGEQELSSGWSNRATRERQQAEIEGFLNDPSQAKLDLTYDTPNLLACVGVAISCGGILLGWFWTRYANIEIDGAAGTLDVVIVRWPLPRKRRQFPLAAVSDAVASKHRERGGRTSYTVRLVVDGHAKKVRVLPGFASSSVVANQVAGAIRALLPRLRERPQ